MVLRLQEFVPAEDWEAYGAYFDHVGKSSPEPFELGPQSPASEALRRALERVNVLDTKTERIEESVGDFIARMAVDDAVKREIIPEHLETFHIPTVLGYEVA